MLAESVVLGHLNGLVAALQAELKAERHGGLLLAEKWQKLHDAVARQIGELPDVGSLAPTC